MDEEAANGRTVLQSFPGLWLRHAVLRAAEEIQEEKERDPEVAIECETCQLVVGTVDIIIKENRTEVSQIVSQSVNVRPIEALLLFILSVSQLFNNIDTIFASIAIFRQVVIGSASLPVSLSTYLSVGHQYNDAGFAFAVIHVLFHNRPLAGIDACLSAALLKSSAREYIV